MKLQYCPECFAVYTMDAAACTNERCRGTDVYCPMPLQPFSEGLIAGETIIEGQPIRFGDDGKVYPA